MGLDLEACVDTALNSITIAVESKIWLRSPTQGDLAHYTRSSTSWIFDTLRYKIQRVVEFFIF